MTIDFTNIEYLKTGNERQQQAYLELSELNIFKKLRRYKPILTGTIPIGIDIPESDLDIVCECSNHQVFAKTITKLYADKNDFEIRTNSWNGLFSTVATFHNKKFKIEIFGQDCLPTHQNAYRHMIIEHKILRANDDEFKAKIIKLKKDGLKTEPAFAKLLGIVGDPYEELLKIEI